MAYSGTVEVMKEFPRALVAVGGHPLAIFGWLLVLVVFMTTRVRRRKLTAILKDLESVPAGRRRYKLEREYKIFPGESRKPLAFVRRKKRRLAWMAAGVTTAVVLSIVGGSVEQTLTSAVASLALDGLRVTPRQFGYIWRLRLENTGSVIAAVDELTLRVANRVRHSDSDRPRPEYPKTPPTDYPALVLSPETAFLPVVTVGQEYAIEPADARNLVFNLGADHPPHEGWIYEVYLELRWHVAGQLVTRTITSKTYRLGWPGLPHWSEPGASGGPGSDPVVDPASIVDR